MPIQPTRFCKILGKISEIKCVVGKQVDVSKNRSIQPSL